MGDTELTAVHPWSNHTVRSMGTAESLAECQPKPGQSQTIPAGVHVVPRRQVAKWLLRHGDVLSMEAVQGIHDAARRSTTWQP
jgi:hypothetical protein